MKILFFGDIDGKIGRQAVAEILPIWKKEYNPDIIIANSDNVTHGKSINKRHLEFFKNLGIDIFTAGDHTLERKETLELLADKSLSVLRPANFSNKEPGVGVKIFKISQKKILVISLLGRTFIDKEVDSPFEIIDKILNQYSLKNFDAIFIDFHAEATSEKSALSWYVDGRVSAIIGTHTHVQTADERILPNGTAALTDVGFCGAVDSVIGLEKEMIIEHFLTAKGFKMNIPESGLAQVNAALIIINNKKATKIIRLTKEVNIS